MSELFSKRAIEIFGAGFLGSCLVGFAIFGTKIFNPHFNLFQFVMSGAIAGALAAAFAVGRTKAIWLVVGLGLVLSESIMRPNTGALILRDLLYMPTLVTSVWLAGFISSKVPLFRVGKILFWGIAFAVCHLAMFGILTAANSVPFNPQLGKVATGIGGLVGLGVGLGVYVSGHQKRAAIEVAP